MGRKTIFEVLKQNNTISKDLTRLRKLFSGLTISTPSLRTTIKSFASTYCFDSWSAKGHCLSLDDFFETIKFDNEFEKAIHGNIISSLFIIEVYYNIWRLVDDYINMSFDKYKKIGQYNYFKSIMDDCLAQLNHTTYYYEDSEQLIVIEDNAAVTAVAEIVEPDFALEIIRYNHYALKGDIKEKQRILKIMADAIEAKQKELKSVDASLYKDIHSLVNNLNIRHNNVEETSKHYHKLVAEMTEEELEKWYDETYQMILLAFLRMDNVERAQKVRELNKSISEENNG